ncbi:MAG: hypothetical protein Q8R08_00170 [bacterium]|nr:hypothetical protein [bacterium]
MLEMQQKKNKGVPTQRFLNLSEIKGDTILMKDGGLRAVIAVSSTNFSLKSEDEQNAIVQSYQSFLNSLDFPIQILMHSRVLDINSYLEKLRNLAAGQTNELLRLQMAEYIEYVARLVEYSSIMSKNFYVIVPYSTGAGGVPDKETFFSKIGKIFNPAQQIATSQEDFEKGKTKLEERVNHVAGALGAMGLRTVVLKTQDLIELLYQSYNLEAASPLHAEAMEEIEVKQ